MNWLHYVKGSRRDALLPYTTYMCRNGREMSTGDTYVTAKQWSFLGEKVALLERDMCTVQWLLLPSNPKG